MTFHILNGDVLADKFPTSIGGDIIIIKEAFIEGPVTSDYTDPGYWSRRAQYISKAYDADSDIYSHQFVSEQVGRMQDIRIDDKVYLWFEDDLFCQANMWFVIHYVTRIVKPQFYRVFPRKDSENWSGFGNADSNDLLEMYNEALAFTANEIELVMRLWDAYVYDDKENLKLLSNTPSTCIRFLPEVVQAHLDRLPLNGNPGRPKIVLREIMDEGKATFYEIFSAFSARAGIYGYGDAQVKNMLREMGYKS